MSTITRQPPLSPKWIPKRLGRLTVDQYEAMVDSGAVTKQLNFVLINGYLVTKVTKKPPHVIAGELLRDEPFGARSAVQLARHGSSTGADTGLQRTGTGHRAARGKAKDYANRHPGPADLALVVEVVKSSLSEDRQMATIYGPAGIPVFWILNLKAHQVEVYTQLKRRGAPGYGKPRIFKTGQSVPVVVDGKEVGRIAVADILPPPNPTSGGNGA